MFVEMKVSGLTIDPLTNTPIVILKDLDGKRAVPIWIGLFEASAIATELEKISFSRPMTHDLLREMVKILDGKVIKIEIIDLKNNTFFALIHLMKDGKVVTIDSRPSDAIALALRVNAPIYIAEQVIEKSRSIDFVKKGEELDKLKKEELKDFLENLSDEDFGKYKM
ncbi:MAG TPA: bifunctional nuclease family protein [Syntrophales bacterium]|nr:bifunctional nuclease family protein [Syntrophales bacterium]HPI57901.1 bifunctional nuclease family protein [Syntrophales bacterium]HPN24559.1 bifunctional nuclease family protein [Syntrophales bacterium]HQM28865.1 bifunctional nuclease family protein [Syntrophales bacterium]